MQTAPLVLAPLMMLLMEVPAIGSVFKLRVLMLLLLMVLRLLAFKVPMPFPPFKVLSPFPLTVLILVPLITPLFKVLKLLMVLGVLVLIMLLFVLLSEDDPLITTDRFGKSGRFNGTNLVVLEKAPNTELGGRLV